MDRTVFLLSIFWDHESWRYHVKRRLCYNFNSWITGEVSRNLAESNGGNLSLPFGWLIVLVDRNYEHRQGESEETREAREDGTDRSIDRGTTKPLSASGVQTQGKLFLLVEVGLLCRKSQGRPCSSTSWQQRAPYILSDSRFWTIAIDSEFEKEWGWKDGKKKVKNNYEDMQLILNYFVCQWIDQNFFLYGWWFNFEELSKWLHFRSFLWSQLNFQVLERII